MTLSQVDYNALKSLPCFKTIVAIELLAGGMSHTCVKVMSTKQVFLAKRLNATTAKAEISAALICAEQGLSPSVIYHNEQWLITEFIAGFNLSTSTLTSDEQVSIALDLMTSLHQLALPPFSKKKAVKSEIPLVDIKKTITALLAQTSVFSANQKLVLVRLTNLLVNEINAQIRRCELAKVVCHGDINFSNILIGSNNGLYLSNDHINATAKPWLIDFECAQLAPIEYDLAMFIAINNIPVDNINAVMTSYMLLAPSSQLNKELLTYYILYSYFINGLWYLANNIGSKLKKKQLLLATEQWSAFDNTVSLRALAFPKLAALLN